MKKILCLLFVGFLFTNSAVNASIIKNLDFTAGLPSDEADITFYNTTGNSEASLYATNSGLLEQRTFSVDGNASYNFPDNNLLGGSFDSSLTTTIEARLRILDINGTGGSYFQAFDGVNRYSAMFSQTGLSLITTSGNQLFAVDVFNFHTYRLESAGNSDILSLFVDNALVGSVNAATNSLNGFGFGDGFTPAGIGANTDWDYLHISQTSSVPTPGAIWLFSLGLIGLIGVRKSFRSSVLLA